MVKKSKKSKSKRVTLKQKHKVLKKVKEHHRKKAKEAKKSGLNHKKRVEKDPGIPNEWPYKEQELKNLEARRARAIEELEQKKAERKERAQKRKLGLVGGNIGEHNDLVESNAEEKSSVFAKSHDHSERSFYKELVKVIEASDVILEVLDARDPLGTRCVDMEKMVMKADPTKRIVLVLNKIDLVPKEAVEKWLRYLRGELPTVAFKASTQEQRLKLGWKSSKADKPSNVPMSTSDCLGAENLIKLLKNYSRSHELKLAVTVGIVGLPNVGKSSLINSLKRSHVVNVGATPGVTRSMQEVQLDKKVKLLDCPGVVMLKSSGSDVSVALRNCKRVEKLDDPVSPVKEIINLCPPEKLLSLYNIPSFTSAEDFLHKVATVRGKLKKGGIVDTDATARIVLHDWNEGKIPYYTLPPTTDGVTSDAVMISELGKEFNVDEVYGDESLLIGGLSSVEEFRHVEIPSNKPPKFDEEMLVEDGTKQKEGSDNAEEAMNDVNDGAAKPSRVGSQGDKLYTAEGIRDPRKLRAEKKQKRKENKYQALTEMNDMDADMNDLSADYKFGVDYQLRNKAAAAAAGTTTAGDDVAKDDEPEPMTGVELDA